MIIHYLSSYHFNSKICYFNFHYYRKYCLCSFIELDVFLYKIGLCLIFHFNNQIIMIFMLKFSYYLNFYYFFQFIFIIVRIYFEY